MPQVEAAVVVLPEVRVMENMVGVMEIIQLLLLLTHGLVLRGMEYMLLAAAEVVALVTLRLV